MNQNSRKLRKLLWQAVLVFGVIIELVLIGFAVVSMIKGNHEIPTWQAIVFMAIAVWIYIAYLKQRAVDISRFIVDEKIKTHALVQNLKEGIILIDDKHSILLINQKAAELTGLDELTALGQDFAAKMDAVIAERLRNEESGEMDGMVLESARRVRVSILPLPHDQDGRCNRIIYVSKPVATDDANTNANRAGLVHCDGRAVRLLREMAAMLMPHKPGGAPADALRQKARMALEALAVSLAADTAIPAATEELELDQWLRELLAEIQPSAGALNILFALPSTGERIKVPRLAVGTALRLAVLNAVLSCPAEGGKVRLRVMPMGTNVGLAVIDNGAPIPTDAVQDLFAANYDGVRAGQSGKIRTDSIGLWRAREICRLCGGTLLANPHPEGGLCATFMLPTAN